MRWTVWRDILSPCLRQTILEIMTARSSNSSSTIGYLATPTKNPGGCASRVFEVHVLRWLGKNVAERDGHSRIVHAARDVSAEAIADTIGNQSAQQIFAGTGIDKCLYTR